VPGLESRPEWKEYRYRVRDPGAFKPNAMRSGSTFVTITIQRSPRVRAVIGRLKSTGRTAVQSLRFPKSAGWNEAKIAAWLKAHPNVKEEGRIEVGNVREALGQGRGVGGPRQGIGGAETCVCPKCGHRQKHIRNIPCAKIKCPKCGTAMRGTNVKKTAQEAIWTTATINDLPDSAFLYIEPGGKKDAEGKTVPRSLRHFPYKDKNGKIDLPHLRNALSRIPQSKIPASVKKRVLAKARQIAANAGINVAQQMRAETRREDEIGTTLEEHAFAEALIKEDEWKEKGLVRGVVILGPHSRNKRTYLTEAMVKAVPLYNGVRIFANHQQPGQSRSIRDLIGKIVNPRFEGGKIRGDAQILESHRSWVLPLIREVPNLCGFSHDARGVVFVHKGEEIVEEIKAVHSADLVVDPATTRGIFEETGRRKERKRMEEELQRQISTLTEDKALLAAELEEKEKEIAALRKELDEVKVKEKLAQRKALIASLLKEADLPETAVTDQFKAILEKAASDEEVKAIIDDRKKLIEMSRGTGGVGEESHPAADGKVKIQGKEVTAQDFAESITAP